MSAPTTTRVDPIAFAQSLIRCPSVTPEDGGTLDLLQQTLEGLGFRCTRLPFSEPGTPDVDNLYARYGDASPHFCFAGHSDVVPVGDARAWKVDPFAGEIRDGYLVGRGASDMKGAIAAFVTAVSRFLEERGGHFEGSISLLITGDEEGPSINGTRKMLKWLADHKETIDHCLIGEPTNPKFVGEMVKIGRRGSLNGVLTIEGVQGHVAYPHLADNPVPKLLTILMNFLNKKLDSGNAQFQPSNLEVTSIDVGNSATNVIPARASARFNIRYNNEHSATMLETWLRKECDAVMSDEAGRYTLDLESSGAAFVTEPGPFTELISQAVQKKTGRAPELSTSGGTSDARFIKDVCPVAEFGLLSGTMHKVEEQVPVQAIEDLADIYFNILESYYGS